MRLIRIAFVIVLLALLGRTVVAQDMTGLNVIEYELDNGLQVILVPDSAAPTVAVNVWYRVGGADDPANRSGFAHLFEHMMFQGSENVARGQHFDLITAAGGSANASTALERTNYFQTVPAHQLPLALWLEADRMASLVVDEANFDREREVVKEEYRQRIDNQPYGEASLALQTIAYDFAPYQRPVIGSIEDLEAATIEDVRQFHDIYYVPNNATLVVTGDFNVDDTRAMIDDYFSDIPAGDPVPELPPFEFVPQLEAERVVIEDGLARVPAKLIAYATVPRNHPDHLALELLSRILGSGESSRLAQALIDTGLASNAYTFVRGNRGPGQFGAVLFPNPGVELSEIEQIYYDELESIRTDGVTDAELDKAINQIRMSQVLSMQSALGLAESIQTANFYLDNPTGLFDELDQYAMLTSADIQRVIETYLAPEARHIIEVQPVEETAPAAPAAPSSTESNTVELAGADSMTDRETPPEPLPVRDVVLPEITETTLDNGLRVIVVPQSKLPVLAVQLILPGGASAVPAELAGMADFAAALLTRGTTTRSAQDIAGTIEQIGGQLDASAGRDTFSISSLVLREHADLAFDLLADVTLNPTFPQEELDIQRQRALTSLESSLADPGAVAGRAFQALVYGDHPYGHLVSAATYEAITRAALVDFYDARLNPEQAVLIVAGDIDPDAALARAEAAFGDWTGTDAVTTTFDYPPVGETERAIYLVDRPGSTQVEILLGQPGVTGQDPDRRSLQVMNQVLGGGAASRLFQNLREREGYTYGVYSGFTYPRGRGTFQVVAAVRPEVLVPALEAVFAEIERIQTEPVSSDELAKAQSSLLGSYARSIESVLGLARQIASFEARGLPWSDLTTFPQAVENTDAADVLTMAQTYIDPAEMILVVVGDASVIGAELETLGPVVRVDANGAVIE